MSARYTITPRARRDLSDIYDYTARRWGISQAEIYIRQLQRAVNEVAAQPTIGRPCPEIRAGYFRYLSGSHAVFYRSAPNGIEIIRILHTRMDVGRHL